MSSAIEPTKNLLRDYPGTARYHLLISPSMPLELRERGKMRVAILNTLGIPARYGGTETCVEEVSTRLATKGHDITVYCGGQSGQKNSTYKRVNLINVKRMPDKMLDFSFRSLLSTLNALGRHYDIFHYFGTDSAFIALIPRVMSRKVVLSLDGFPWNRSSYPSWVRTVLRFSAWQAMYVPQATTVDSMNVGEWYRRTCGKAPAFIPYGAKIMPRLTHPEALSRFGLEPGRYLLFVGVLLPEKGIHYIIQAFHEIESRFPLVIVGSNPYGSSYEQSLRRMAGGKDVRFLGPVYGADMENLYRGAYLYVNASETEGTSPAILQAMGCGNCVLASDIPQNLESIGDAGVSFRNKNPEDLAKKIKYLLSNADIVEDHRRKAVDRVARLYSWDSIADRFEKVYLSLSRETARHTSLEQR